MTDLKHRLMLMLADEPDEPRDIEHIISAGRRARRRRQAAIVTAGTIGAAGLGAAVAIPIAYSGGGSAVQLGVRPSPTPSPSATSGKCYLVSSPPKEAKLTLQRLVRSGRVGSDPTVKQLPKKNNGRRVLEVCSAGATADQPNDDAAKPPAGPPYHYTEDPAAIAARLGAHLHDRVTGFGLTISYTRPFAQESTKLESGHPSYFGGNVDVHESNGYGDIGVQVRHETTEPVPFDGDCTGHCQMTKLPGGSVLRTDQVKAGRGDTVLTAEVHRPDGVIVQAQESNYPFGPDAGTQAHGDQPLTLDQLISLAQDPDFTF